MDDHDQEPQCHHVRFTQTPKQPYAVCTLPEGHDGRHSDGNWLWTQARTWESGS